MALAKRDVEGRRVRQRRIIGNVHIIGEGGIVSLCLQSGLTVDIALFQVDIDTQSETISETFGRRIMFICNPKEPSLWEVLTRIHPNTGNRIWSKGP